MGGLAALAREAGHKVTGCDAGVYPPMSDQLKALGIDLVQFGVVVILNFMIAMITPPYGLILFVLGSLTGVPMKEINREIWQFCIPWSVVMFLMIFYPSITLWLPRQFGYLG